MYFFLAFVFAGVFAICFLKVSNLEDPLNNKNSRIPLTIGLFAIVLCLICASEYEKLEELKNNSAYLDEVQSTFYELVSLQDTTRINGSLSGNLFYISGSVNEEDFYSFYYKLESGYKKDKIPTHNTIIYEYILDNGLELTSDNADFYKIPNPSDEKYSILYDEKGNFRPGIIKYDVWCRYNLTEKQKKLLTTYPEDYIETTRYEIHVPKGTILREFNLDSL